MSSSESSLSERAGAPAEPARSLVQPVWLRPVILIGVLALHASLLLIVTAQPAPLAPLNVVEVTLTPRGDSALDQAKQEEITPAEQPPPVPSSEQPETTAPPQIVAPEAVPLPLEKSKPVVQSRPKPVAEDPEDDEPTPAKLRAQKHKAQEAAERRRKAQEARLAQRRGAADSKREAVMSRGNYAGLLAAELRRHQFYPAAARSQGATGSVGVAFTVGPSGRVVRQSITQSSGSTALDGAARAMMSAVQTPPPPGGSFSTSTTIRFHLN